MRMLGGHPSAVQLHAVYEDDSTYYLVRAGLQTHIHALKFRQECRHIPTCWNAGMQTHTHFRQAGKHVSHMLNFLFMLVLFMLVLSQPVQTTPVYTSCCGHAMGP